MALNHREIFRRAAELISGPGCWTQESFARAADGTEVHPIASSARSWCALGAVEKAAGDDHELCRACIEAMMQKNNKTITWNDSPGRTQAEVVAFLEALAADES